MGVPNTTGDGTLCHFKPGSLENTMDLKGNNQGTVEGQPNATYEPQPQPNRV